VAVPGSVAVGNVSSADEVIESKTLIYVIYLVCSLDTNVTYHANLDRVVVSNEKPTRAITKRRDTVWSPNLIGNDGANMSHLFLALPHLKNLDRRVCAAFRSINNLVGRIDWWPLVDKVEAHSVIVQDLDIKAQKIEIRASIRSFIMAYRLDAAKIVETVFTRLVDIQGEEFRSTEPASGYVEVVHAVPISTSGRETAFICSRMVVR